MSRAAQRMAESGAGAAAKSKTSLPRRGPILRDLENPIWVGWGMLGNEKHLAAPEAPPPTIIVHIRSLPEAT